MLTTMRVSDQPLRPSSLGLVPLPGTWLMAVVAVLSITATGVASVASEPGDAPPPSEVSATSTASIEGSAIASPLSNAAGPSTQPSVSTPAESDPPPRPDGHTVPAEDILNHGQVVRQGSDLGNGSNRGCVTRPLATSDLGKKNADPDPDGPRLGADGAVDPDSVDLDCVNGKGSGTDTTEFEPSESFVEDEPTSGNDKDEGKGKAKGTSKDS